MNQSQPPTPRRVSTVASSQHGVLVSPPRTVVPTTNKRRSNSSNRNRNRNLSRNQSYDDDEEEEEERLSSKWMSPSPSSSLPTGAAATASTATTAKLTQPPSFLTMVLLQTHQLLPKYCQLLSHPVSVTNATRACLILDETGTSSTNNHNNVFVVVDTATPISFFLLPPSSIKQHQQPPSSLENDIWWETYISPFLLFAAAEVLYAQLEHIVVQASTSEVGWPYSKSSSKSLSKTTTPPPPPTTTTTTIASLLQRRRRPIPTPPSTANDASTSSTNTNTMTMESCCLPKSSILLMELYQRIDQDLHWLQEIVCEPLVRRRRRQTSNNDKNNYYNHTTNSNMDQYQAAATVVTHHIGALSVIASIRCQMITLQSLLFGTTSMTTTTSHNIANHTDNVGENSSPAAASSPFVSMLLMRRPTYLEAATATTMWLQTIDSAMKECCTHSDDDDDDDDNNITGRDSGNDNNDDERKQTTSAIEEDQQQQSLLAVRPMLQSLQNEVYAWKYYFETCHALEHCQFLDTMVSLRYWQSHLPPSDDDTTYSRYMNASFQRIRSLLPIYFDQTRTYANHSYGFNTSLLLRLDRLESKNTTDPNDHNSLVLDLLFRQEKLNGPSMAIGIVFNAISTVSNLHVERGFCIDKDADTKKSDDARVVWPAIYLRSTLHLPTPPPPKSDAGGSGLFASSQASLLSTWASGSSHGLSIPGGSPFSLTTTSRKQPSTTNTPTTTPPSNRKSPKTLSLSALSQIPFSSIAAPTAYGTTTVSLSALSQTPFQHGTATTASTTATASAQNDNHSSALEYGPQSGIVTSWPHNDWASIASILDDGNNTETLHQTNGSTNPDDSPYGQQTDVTFKTVRKTNTDLSTIYSLPLGPLLNLIIMMKDKDDDGQVSYRRKGQITSDDIIAFMNDILGPRLRISTLFSAAFMKQCIVGMRDAPNKERRNRTSSKVAEKLSLPETSGATSSSSFWSNEQEVQAFLSSIKSSFGLRPSSPIRSGSSAWGTPRTPTEVMNNVVRQRQKRNNNSSSSRNDRSNMAYHRSDAASAALFFLGPDLALSFE